MKATRLLLRAALVLAAVIVTAGLVFSFLPTRDGSTVAGRVFGTDTTPPADPAGSGPDSGSVRRRPDAAGIDGTLAPVSGGGAPTPAPASPSAGRGQGGRTGDGPTPQSGHGATSQPGAGAGSGRGAGTPTGTGAPQDNTLISGQESLPTATPTPLRLSPTPMPTKPARLQPDDLAVAPGSTVASTSVTSDGAATQVAIDATSARTPADTVDYYRSVFTALGMKGRPLPAVGGSTAIAFTRGSSTVTLTVSATRSGSRYLVFGVLRGGA